GDLLPARRDRVACGIDRRERACKQPISVMLPVLEQLVLAAVGNRLESELDPKWLKTLAAEQKATRAKLKRAYSALEKQHATLTRHIGNLVSAIAAGVSAPELREQLELLSGRKADLNGRLASVRDELTQMGTGGSES